MINDVCKRETQVIHRRRPQPARVDVVLPKSTPKTQHKRKGRTLVT
jgi:hypothetical protein